MKKKLTSKNLQVIQDILLSHVQTLLVEPDCDFAEVSKICKVIDKIDSNRRKAWHKEKFGVYEEIADDMFGRIEKANEIDPDDIPF